MKLGDVLELHRGYDLPKGQRIDGKVPVISSSGVSGSHNVAKCDGANVVTGRYGTIGEVFFHEGPCWPLNTTLYVSDFKGNDERYIYYLLKYALGTLMRGDGSDKSTVPGVDRNVLHMMDVPFEPGSARQKELVSLLSAIDAKIETNTKVITELDSLARTVYDHIIRGPKDWPTGKLGDLGEVISGATPSTSNASNYAESGVAWITPDDLSGKNGSMFISHGARDITSEGLSSCSARLMPRGAVVMSSRAPIGYIAVAQDQFCTNQGCKSIVPGSGYSSWYIYFTLKRYMLLIESQGSGTTFKEVSKEVLASIPIAAPPKEVVARLTEQAAPLCEQREQLERESSDLAALRDYLLPMLMNGQVSIDSEAPQHA